MKTSFTPAQLADPAIAEADAILRECQHYGFCTAVCPTYVLLGDENDAPRGRIDLIREMLEKGGAPSAKTVGHIDKCLSCLSCMTTCAVKVDYVHLVDRARIHIEENFRRPLADRAIRAFVAATVPKPRRFAAALRAARFGRPFRRLMPGRLRVMVELAPKSLPNEKPIAPGVYPAEGARRMRVALLQGCAQQVLAPHLNAATLRLLRRHGCEVVVSNVECCGALTLHMGKEKLAKQAARQCIDAWTNELSAGGLDAVIVNASGCGSTVKDYGHLFQRDNDFAAAAARIGKLTQDVTQIMVRLGLKPTAEARRFAVAYHDACSLQHVQKIVDEPRALLAQAGFVVRDVPERHFCCGSAGTYNMLQPDIAAQLGRRKAGHIDSTDAEIVAAGNLGCIAQISGYTARPVVHTVELLDWATGGPMPPALYGVALTPVPDAAPVSSDDANAIW